jgi:hypothetical protein
MIVHIFYLYIIVGLFGLYILDPPKNMLAKIAIGFISIMLIIEGMYRMFVQ